MADCEIRSARLEDLPELTEIYNYYVRGTAITFDVEPFSVEGRRAWFDQFAEHGPYRLAVATNGGKVLGYASSMRFRTKPAYNTSVETTIYLRPDSTGQGVGSRLYSALFELLRSADLHRAYAGITQPNPESVALHERARFSRLGVYREVGYKLGRYWDVEWFERELG